MAQEETKKDNSGTGEASIVASPQTPVSSIVPQGPAGGADAWMSASPKSETPSRSETETTGTEESAPKKKKKSGGIKNPEKTSAKELLKQTETLRDVSRTLEKLNDGQRRMEKDNKQVPKLLEAVAENIGMTISPLTKMAQNIKTLCQVTERNLPQIEHYVGNMFTMLYDAIDEDRRFRLQDMENRREFGSAIADLTDAIDKIGTESVGEGKEAKPKSGGIDWAKLAGVAAAALAFIPGMILGFFKQIAKEIKAMFSDALLARVRKIGTWISGKFDKIVSGIRGVFRALTEPIGAFFERMVSKGRALLRIVQESSFGKFFSGLGEVFERIGSKIKALSRIVMDSPIMKFVQELGGMFKNLGTKFMDIVKSVKEVLGAGAEGGGFISKIKDAFKAAWETITGPFKSFKEAFAKLAPKFLAMGEIFGKIIGKLALPLTIVMGIWDFFKGFSEKEGSFGEKFQSGMIGLVNGLVGWIVDIPKSLISWIAGKLGFTELEKELDAISFKDFFTEFVKQGQLLFEGFFEFILITIPKFFSDIVPKIVSKAVDVLGGAWDWIADGIRNIAENIKSNFMDMFSGLGEIVDSIKGLFTGEVDFKTLFLQMIAGIVKTLLFPLNGVAKLVGFNITEKVLDLLGLKSSGGGSGASPAAAPASAVSATPEPTYTPGFLPEFKQELALRERMVPNAQRADGQQLSEMSTQTQAARDEAALSGTGSNVVDASSRTNIINNNQTAAVSGSEIPDRTSGVFMMRFGY